jgi:hypothetical protein
LEYLRHGPASCIWMDRTCGRRPLYTCGSNLSTSLLSLEEPSMATRTEDTQYIHPVDTRKTSEDHSPNDLESIYTPTPFKCPPPDLTPVGPWYKRVLRLLLGACLLYPSPTPLIEEGILHLRAHRCNYSRSNPDPQRLQLLWWMFPVRHWDALREGSSMNFIHQPRCEITPNSPMEEE